MTKKQIAFAQLRDQVGGLEDRKHMRGSCSYLQAPFAVGHPSPTSPPTAF